jgi:hypothetical protein
MPTWNRLAEAHRVGEQQPWSKLLQSPLDRLNLKPHRLEDAHVGQVEHDTGGRHLSQLCFQKQIGETVAAGIVLNELWTCP